MSSRLVKPKRMDESKNRRVLLDENVDSRLKPQFDEEFDVYTIRDKRWNGMKNGALLRAASEEFDLFVTLDQNIPYQQNLEDFDLAIIVIQSISNALVHVSPHMPQINEVMHKAEPGKATFVGQ